MKEMKEVKDMKKMKDMTKSTMHLPAFTWIVGVLVVLVGGAPGLSPSVLATQQTASAAPHAIPRLRLDEFRARHTAGSVLVVDVRDEIVFRAGHIPGALNVPLAEIDRR